MLVSVPQRVLVRPLWGGLKGRAVRRLEERDPDAGPVPHAAVPGWDGRKGYLICGEGGRGRGRRRGEALSLFVMEPPGRPGSERESSSELIYTTRGGGKQGGGRREHPPASLSCTRSRLFRGAGFRQATISGSSGNVRASTPESDWSQEGLACLSPKLWPARSQPENRYPSLTALTAGNLTNVNVCNFPVTL